MNNHDRPNGDLKIGDFFRITKWVGDKEFVDRRGVVTPFGMVVSQSTTHEEKDEDDDRRQPNKALLCDVLEVLAVDYPHLAVRCHSFHPGQNKSRFVLDMKSFESSKEIDETYRKLMVEAQDQ